MRILIFVACLVPCVAGADLTPTPSLAELLARNGIPEDLVEAADLALPVSSGFEEAAPAHLIAEYLNHGDNRLDGTFYLFRRDPSSNSWRGAHLTWPEWDMDRGLCAGGSILAVKEAGAFIYVDGHASPSASCTMVLDASLSAIAYLYGWVVEAFADGSVVYVGSMIHFAPSHSERLWLFDPHTRQRRQIYPPESHEPLRDAFIAQVLASRAVCCENPSLCGPYFKEDACGDEDFDESVTGLTVDNKKDALSFRVQWSYVGREDEDTERRLVYFYRNVHSATAIEHRAYTEAEFVKRFGRQVVTPSAELLQGVFEAQ